MSSRALDRRLPKALAMLALALAAPAPVAAAQPKNLARPNFVVIVIDDLGWTDLGCYGSKYYRTPNIDHLAADGMRFTQAYSACPVCSPTRAALLTGKYPARLHLTDYIPGMPSSPRHRLLRLEFLQQLPLEELTLAEILAGAGYATAAIGKWHLGGDGFEPTRQGFELGIGGGADGSVRSHFAPYLLREGRDLPGLDHAPPAEYLTDRLTSEAERFIEAHAAQPFLLYLPQYAVHTPIMAPPEIVARYQAVPKSGLQDNPQYAAMVESMDQSVGRIVRKLDTLGLTENTVVVFTSDNGGLATGDGPRAPATNNAPLREGKGWLYEGGIRVPLVIKWPATIKRGATCAEPVSSIDLLPTIAELCGLKLPQRVDGASMLPLWKQSGALARRELYWHYPHYSPQGGRPGGAVRDGDFKLVEFHEQNRRELYNLALDTSESTNLFDRQPERVAQMAAKLAAWRTAVGAEMAQPNPDYKPNAQASDGAITLSAETADVHGVMLRYEPLPRKKTLGFWVRADDWASWDFDVNTAGRFDVEILQGCGTGSGGSQVEFSVGEQSLMVTVAETGGFQKFVARPIGQLTLDNPGRYTLSVKPRSKPGPAVMDLRQIRLIPTPDPAGSK